MSLLNLLAAAAREVTTVITEARHCLDLIHDGKHNWLIYFFFTRLLNFLSVLPET